MNSTKMADSILEICEEITSAIICADAAGVIDKWLAESGIRLGEQPIDPQYSVFREFYDLTKRLKQEYQPREITLALEQFPYQQRAGLLFLLPPDDDRSSEIKAITYCLQAIEEKRDRETAFRKWIN